MYHKKKMPHVVKNNQKERANYQLNFEPRFYLYLEIALLGFLAVIFSLSISASLFGMPNIHSPLGDFFANSYGILSFIIPAYFVCAALILFDKTFRPRWIFLLNSIIFPFLTLAISFSFMRDFDFYAQEIAVFETIGRQGLSLITVAITMLECFVIISLASLFFPASSTRKVHGTKTSYTPSTNQNNEVKILRIPFYTKENSIPPQEKQEIITGHPAAAVFQEPSLEDINKEFSVVFDELTDKLSSLSDDLGLIDFKFDKLDENIKTLNSELGGALNQTGERATLELIEDIEDAELIETIDAHLRKGEQRVLEAGDQPFYPLSENIDPLADDESIENSVYDSDETVEGFDIDEDEFTASGGNGFPVFKAAGERQVSSELETIIEKAEAAAAIKTEEILKSHDNPDSKKKAAPLKVPKKYSIPLDGILKEYADNQYWIIDDTTRKAARILTETLNEFNIKADVTGIRKGPVITSFEILPSPGVKLSKIVNLQDNIALRLAAASVRIVAPIPGKHAVGIEIPNKNRNIVSFREIIEGELNKKDGRKAEIPVVLGKNITGEAVTVDLATMPHLLIAGSTGSGKSVCVNTLILSILYQCTPAQCKLILIDPKIVELKLYNDIAHLLTPVITEPKRAFQALQYCIFEMERRYSCLDSIGARDIKTYNRRIKERNIAAEYMPYIVVVIDEFADLMATTGKELESTVARLAAMSRAVGIHLVLATQRPSIDVITGLIKSNIPSRIAFMVASMMDSRIIIDTTGAEKLLGRGDMLYSGVTEPFPIRLQGAFVSEDEVERVVEYVKNFGEPEYIDEEIFFDEEDDEVGPLAFEDGDDPLYEKAMGIVIQQGKASASYIQRRLKIGYNRAARLIEEMERRGVVGPSQGSRPRDLLRAV
ncbi:MAG: DNA translocase FtsK [Spirochaetaceae bacterium]|jgi:S-DNA-T family DNA segregation ATPase FtsK/SpoIIIE|nr:DNA translocase FtsK [Spirochaetaceae bacterium]